MSTIPQEYLMIRSQEDFGFSAVDELEVKQVVDETTLETKVIKDTVSASSESITRLEAKIDAMLDMYNQEKFGLDSKRVQLEETVKSRLTEVEKLIMPLLVNLMKNTDKEYIYWPNRKEKIQEQIDKILALTRGT
jgi:hypothetical protein